MFYAQELLRMQFPTIDGWQSTLLAQNNGYLPAKMDAIQIHIVPDSHWVTSARLRNFTPFPTKKVKRARHTLIMNIDVFCSCQMPDTYGDMVQCGLCKQWFHIKCVGLHSLPSSAEEWNCSLCTYILVC